MTGQPRHKHRDNRLWEEKGDQLHARFGRDSEDRPPTRERRMRLARLVATNGVNRTAVTSLVATFRSAASSEVTTPGRLRTKEVKHRSDRDNDARARPGLRRRSLD